MSITCGFWKLRSFKAPGRQKLVASAGGAAWLGPFAERVTMLSSHRMADTDSRSFSCLFFAASLCISSAGLCGVKPKQHVCVVSLSGSHTLSCPVRGSLSSRDLLPWCRPAAPGGWMVQARGSLLPSPVSLFCSVLSDCVAQVSYVDSRALPEFFLFVDL